MTLRRTIVGNQLPSLQPSRSSWQTLITIRRWKKSLHILACVWQFSLYFLFVFVLFAKRRKRLPSKLSLCHMINKEADRSSIYLTENCRNIGKVPRFQISIFWFYRSHFSLRRFLFCAYVTITLHEHVIKCTELLEKNTFNQCLTLRFRGMHG